MLVYDLKYNVINIYSCSIACIGYVESIFILLCKCDISVIKNQRWSGLLANFVTGLAITIDLRDKYNDIGFDIPVKIWATRCWLISPI